jgi:excisionase family DNA binding protein
MQTFIITTPEQLKTVIAETVNNALTARFEAQSTPEPAKDIDSDLLTRKQAAMLLGVSYPTLNEWSKSGIITGYRISTRVRYKRSELEQSLLQMQTQKSRLTKLKKG